MGIKHPQKCVKKWRTFKYIIGLILNGEVKSGKNFFYILHFTDYSFYYRAYLFD